MSAPAIRLHFIDVARTYAVFLALLAIVRTIERFPLYTAVNELLNLRVPRVTPEGRSAP